MCKHIRPTQQQYSYLAFFAHRPLREGPQRKVRPVSMHKNGVDLPWQPPRKVHPKASALERSAAASAGAATAATREAAATAAA